MPTYCYITDDGEHVEQFWTIQEMQRRQDKDGAVTLGDGRLAFRDYRSEKPGGHMSGNWPMASDALGVHPKQVKEATLQSVEHGVPTEFNRHGQAILRDRAHRKAFMKARGFYDRDGGVGDAT